MSITILRFSKDEFDPSSLQSIEVMTRLFGINLYRCATRNTGRIVFLVSKKIFFRAEDVSIPIAIRIGVEPRFFVDFGMLPAEESSVDQLEIGMNPQ